jgi:hypothetical protein
VESRRNHPVWSQKLLQPSQQLNHFVVAKVQEEEGFEQWKLFLSARDRTRWKVATQRADEFTKSDAQVICAKFVRLAGVWPSGPGNFRRDKSPPTVVARAWLGPWLRHCFPNKTVTDPNSMYWLRKNRPGELRLRCQSTIYTIDPTTLQPSRRYLNAQATIDKVYNACDVAPLRLPVRH